MEKIKTSLVLEGGGLRGAYTAGALSWLVDNKIKFDNAYGISTGAVHLLNYLMGSKDDLFLFSVDGIRDKGIIGIRPLLRCGRIVDYNYLFDYKLPKEMNFDFSSLKKCDINAYIGLYDLKVGKTKYYPVQDMDMQQLKASTTLPILGKIVKHNGEELLDGGITDMIPIDQAIKDGCNRNLIIATKPADYVRKPAKKIIVDLMKAVYPQCENISIDYRDRHINYYRQIELIKNEEANHNAIYMYPSKHSDVSRLKGSREELVELYELGYQDMENRREDILKLLKK